MWTTPWHVPRARGFTFWSSLRRGLFRLLALFLPATALLLVTAPTADQSSSPPSRRDAGPVPQLGPASLWQLGPLLAADGRVGAVVADTRRGVLFRQNAAETHMLASVAKIYILAAYLDTLAAADREPTEDELWLMEAMIEQSDNVSASELWSSFGRYEGLAAFLQSRGLPAPQAPSEEAAWGDMRASALDVSEVLTSLYNGRLLDDERTELALDLLANVIDSQAWGLGTARENAMTYLKNGWYPEEDGWVVNSVGIVDGRFGEYVVVLLTDSQPTFEAGVRIIENAVLFVRAALL